MNKSEKSSNERISTSLNWREAARNAASCRNFKEDEEEEQVADDTVSCFNCKYRKWTKESYICIYSQVK